MPLTETGVSRTHAPGPLPSAPPPEQARMNKRSQRRHETSWSLLENIQLRPASALREVLAEGYTRADLRSDVLAGIVVGIVALPLSMALAIASGVAPQYGLYTAIIAGFLTALLGGSRVQVSGPTAAFVVVLQPIAERSGLGGLLVATMMAGALLIVLGMARMGRLIQFIPHPVTTGFTGGIAVVIATLQVRDFLGLTVKAWPDHYADRVLALLDALPTTRWPDVVIGVGTLVILLGWARLLPRVARVVPAPLVALLVMSVAALTLHHLLPDFDVMTIGKKFSYRSGGEIIPGIPRLPPQPVLPWSLPGGDGQPLEMSWTLIRVLFPSAFAIAMLGAIESLLSAVVADGMAGTRHDPDSELIAQGTSNLVAPFFGGIASTGAIARTATNIRAGGRSPIAAMVHALFVLAAVLLLAPLVAYLPMASLAGLLLLVAWNMSEIKHFKHMIKVAPKSDITVLLTCFGLTVMFDMVIAVTAGVLLAALLFMRRMAEITGGTLTEGDHPSLDEPLPAGAVLYQIAGPLFFGATQKAMSSLDQVTGTARVVIFDMGAVPAMDATGLVAFESALDRLEEDGTYTILAGTQAQPARVLQKAEIEPDHDILAMVPTLHEAVLEARAWIDRHPPPD